MKMLNKNDDMEQIVKKVADYDEFMKECGANADDELSEDDLTMVTAAGSGMSYQTFAEKYLGKK